MAALSRTGTTARESVVQLRRIMLALIKPAAQSVKALATVGMTAAGLRDIIQKQGSLRCTD